MAMNKVLVLIAIEVILLGYVNCEKCGTSAIKRKGRSIESVFSNLTDATRDNANGTNSPVTYIIGGRLAKAGEFPWQVFLKIYYQKGSKSFTACGGVIWDANFVLTAAHCFLKCENKKTKKAAKVTVCVGEYNTKKKDGEQCSDAAKWINHEKFKACDKHFKNDITLVKLKKPLKMKLKKGAGSINAACHPSNKDKPKTVTLSGWGRTSTKSQSGSDKLKTIELPVWTTKKCKKKWKTVDDSQICVGGDAGKNSCQGDSGGPVVTFKGGAAYVIGLSSYGPTPCAQKGVPNVFTRVAHFNGWISKTIKKNKG